jgi:hypothetical protein
MRGFHLMAGCAAMGLVAVCAFGQTAAPSAAFPLAAAAGQDSGQMNAAPAGAVNQGPLDPAKWKYGPAYDAPANAGIWNPVMIKMMKGEKVTGGTVLSTDTPETYCAMANAGYDFIWTEMQHSARDWDAVAKHVEGLSSCKGSARGTRGVYGRARDSTCDGPGRAGDYYSDGAICGGRNGSAGLDDVSAAGQAKPWRGASGRSVVLGRMFRAGISNTINKNVVLIEMIETIEGAKDAPAIAAIPGVTAIFAASGDLGTFPDTRWGRRTTSG